jgi:hypothetical protein
MYLFFIITTFIITTFFFKEKKSLEIYKYVLGNRVKQ